MGAMHMALLGPEGLEKLALRVAATTEATKQAVCAIDGVDLVDPGTPNFRDFAVKLPGQAADAVTHMDASGVLGGFDMGRSEEHTSELQSRRNLVCRLLLEKKNKQ